jgi:hypothetical protein
LKRYDLGPISLGVVESGCVGFLECDQSAGELKQGEVVLGFLRPADQERAVAVEPGVAGFDDPASGAPAGSGAFHFEFVAASTDVRREAAADREFVDPRVGVAAVETEALRMLGGRFGTVDRQRVKRRR